MPCSRAPLRVAIAAAAAAAAVACSTPSPAPRFTPDDERAVRAVDSVYVAAWLRDDTAAVMNTLARHAVLMPAGQRILPTTDAIRAFWWPSDSSHTRILTFQRTIDEVGGDANVASIRAGTEGGTARRCADGAALRLHRDRSVGRTLAGLAVIPSRVPAFGGQMRNPCCPSRRSATQPGCQGFLASGPSALRSE